MTFMRCPCSPTTLRFLVLWLFIAAVSSYDAYLLVCYPDSLPYMESNPVGVYLVEVADGDVSVFLNCKVAGTVVVLCSLLGLYRKHRRWAMPVAHGLAIFQFGLLLYLTFVTTRPNKLNVVRSPHQPYLQAPETDPSQHSDGSFHEQAARIDSDVIQ